MNLSALTRNLLRLPARTARRAAPTIEPLEARIAPATFSATTVTFLESNGDTATVVISKPLFTAANVSKVFNFASGSFTDTGAQQLDLLNITKLGQAAKGIDITITATTPGNMPGVVDIGYINASGIDLGNVTVGGDLGRIAAGDLTLSSPGLASLTVNSLGADGTATQLPGGNLNTLISGAVGSITVNGDIDGASIGIGGGSHGLLTSLTVTGSINGGAGAYAGSVRTQGGITNVRVDGSIIGGSGLDSGVIGTAGSLGTVVVDGSVIGGGGTFSGAILSTKSMQSIQVDGGLAGGAGLDSGQIGTAANLTSVTIGGSVTGGGGNFSGDILASGNITTATVDGDLVGGGGTGSGQVGSGGSIETVTIEGAMSSGAEIHAFQNIGSVTVTPEINTLGIHKLASFAPGIVNSFVIANHGSIGSITAGNIVNSGFNAGGSIGTVSSIESISGSVFIAGINLGANLGVTGAGTFNNTSAASFGFGSSSSGVAAHIGNISVGIDGLIEQSTFIAGVHGAGADHKFGTKDDSVATGSSVGTITSPGGLNTVFVESGDIGATTSGAVLETTYISTDTAVSAAGIGALTVTVPSAVSGEIKRKAEFSYYYLNYDGILDSTFISNAGIGPVNVTISGERADTVNAGISTTTFQAGHALGSITVTDNAYGSNGSNYGIYNSTFNGGLNGYGGTGDISVTLTDPGPDGNSAAIVGMQVDASVCSCMSANMGSISAENADTGENAAGIVDSVFRVHGNIGPISATMDSGSPTAPAIQGSVFSAFGSIGDINVYGAVLPNESSGPSRFLAGYDIGTDMTFGNEDLSAKSLALHAGQSIGDVTVTGYFEGSDIAASINPGSGYVFGDSTTGASASNDTNIGAGGSIGFVTLGENLQSDGSPFASDHATSHGIEAANFALGEGSFPTVIALGYTGDIPVVLYVDGGSNDVRITNLTQGET